MMRMRSDIGLPIETEHAHHPAFNWEDSDIMNTLLMIKPEIVSQGLIGEIITIILRNRFTITKMQLIHFDRARAERFYEVHKGRDFYPALIDYITSGPVVVLELEADNAIDQLRSLIGNTDPAAAAPGTIRYVYGTSIQQNAVHASDSSESAKKELAIAFGGT
jgi:nucleoside-diphosphate kinase